MVSKFGIILNNYGQNQLAFDTLQTANEFLRMGNKVDLTLFYETPVPLRQSPLTALMNLYEAWNYDGTVVATSVSSAFKVLGMPIPNQRYFYVYNPEWIHNHTIYEAYYKLAKSDIEFIARTKEHADLIINNFNKVPKFILEQMNVEALWQALNSFQQS